MVVVSDSEIAFRLLAKSIFQNFLLLISKSYFYRMFFDLI